jgi:branched-chain amino acid transport system permease protein
MTAIAEWFDVNLINMLNGVALGLLLFTMAVGLSLIFGLMGVLNLAHGAIFLVGGYVAYQVTDGGGSFVVAALLAIAIAVVLGAGIAGLVRPIASRGYLDQALLTLGISIVLADAVSIKWGNSLRSVMPPSGLRESTSVFGQPYPAYRLGVIVAGTVIAIGIYLVFERTHAGAVVRAAVVDREIVSALGINVTAVLATVFAIGSALAAIGGVIGAPILNVSPGLDVEVLVLALIVVVIGGLGSVKGALAGALLIGQVQSLGVALLPDLAPFLLFGVMALVLVFRPAGLFGRVTA